jgi:hypothetical protein
MQRKNSIVRRRGSATEIPDSTTEYESPTNGMACLNKQVKLFCGDLKLMSINCSDFSDKKVFETTFDAGILSITARATSNTVLLGLMNGHLLEVHADSGEVANDYGKLHSDQIRGIFMNTHQTHVWTCAEDGSVQRVQLAAKGPAKFSGGEVVIELKAGMDISSCALRQNGTSLFFGDYDGKIRCLDLETKKFDDAFTQKIHGSRIYSMALTRDGEKLITADTSCTVSVFNIAEKKQENCFKDVCSTRIHALALLSCDTRACVGSFSGELIIISLQDG